MVGERFLTAAIGGDDDADNVQGKWIGLAIVITSAVLSNLGVNVQKLSHVREEEKPVFERQTYYTRPLWLTGLVLVVLGAVGDFEALGFAPQALVASVGGGFTVLANVFFAHLWLGQILTRTDVLGTLLIIIGVVLSTVANEPDEQMSLVELEKQFFQLGFLIYLGVMTVVLGAIFGQIEAISRLPRALNESKYRLLPFMYATASGIFGSFSVLLAKCASILLILTVSGENQFVYFTTYLFMGGMMCTLVLQTDLLNRAIMVGDTLSVFPMFQCFWIGSSVIGGVVFYESTRASRSLTGFVCRLRWPVGFLFHSTCFVLIIMGIYLLAKHGEDESDDLDDPEHTTPGHRAHLTGHFGALMPLSPQGHSYSTFSRKSFDDRDSETTPLRYTPSNGRVSDHSGYGGTNGYTNGNDKSHRSGHPVGHWHGPHGRRHHSDDLEEQRLYSGSI
ncbi:Magnesium transporter NIPA [Phytophthora infestans]|uniref:Magnesium transporter NIPA n=1 Tax=Phytophthora infestans TaxID=4787 RepID=A0A833SVL7_PHYIN|nr:Magnesium transporter NIPA [Phytophthora infestans]